MSRKRVARLLSSVSRWPWLRYRSLSGRASLPHVARIRRIVRGLESLEAIAAAAAFPGGGGSSGGAPTGGNLAASGNEGAFVAPQVAAVAANNAANTAQTPPPSTATTQPPAPTPAPQASSNTVHATFDLSAPAS